MLQIETIENTEVVFEVPVKARKPASLHILGTILILLLPVYSAAQSSNGWELCRSSDAEPETRLTACDALVESSDETEVDKALLARAQAYGASEQYKAAIADLTRILERNPEDADALWERSRALHRDHIYNGSDSEQLALSDATALVKLYPDEARHHWWYGRLLEFDEAEVALEAFNRAIVLKDDYVFAYLDRADVKRRLRMFDEAEQDYLAALEIAPFSSSAHHRYGTFLHGRDDLENAAKHYLQRQILDPNLYWEQLARAIAQVTPKLQSIELLPHTFEPPENGLSIRYLKIILPKDTRDDMIIAIDALANWFVRIPRAKPLGASYFVSTLANPSAGSVKRSFEYEREWRSRKLGRPKPQHVSATTRKGLMRQSLETGRASVPVRLDINNGNPDDIWPLKVGRLSEGDGVYTLVCPETIVMAAIMAGCGPDVQTVQIAEFKYRLEVLDVEQIRVPLGTFDTFVVRYREKSRRTGGNYEQRNAETTWWYAPKLATWVKRIDQEGEYMAETHAVELLDGAVE